jgi:hypothetical protein
MRKSNTIIPGDQPDADSGSRNRKLSRAARTTYADALKAGGTKRETMEEFVQKDKARTDAVKASRAASAAAMRQR